MSEKFTVEIISPDRTVVKTSTSEVRIPSYEGEMGILKDHIPLITFLRPGLIKIIEKTEEKIFVEDGTVEFVKDNLLILTSTATRLKEMNKGSLDNIINEAEKKITDESLSDKEKYLLSYKIEALKNVSL